MDRVRFNLSTLSKNGMFFNLRNLENMGFVIHRIMDGIGKAFGEERKWGNKT